MAVMVNLDTNRFKVKSRQAKVYGVSGTASLGTPVYRLRRPGCDQQAIMPIDPR